MPDKKPVRLILALSVGVLSGCSNDPYPPGETAQPIVGSRTSVARRAEGGSDVAAPGIWQELGGAASP